MSTWRSKKPRYASGRSDLKSRVLTARYTGLSLADRLSATDTRGWASRGSGRARMTSGGLKKPRFDYSSLSKSVYGTNSRVQNRFIRTRLSIITTFRGGFEAVTEQVKTCPRTKGEDLLTSLPLRH